MVPQVFLEHHTPQLQTVSRSTGATVSNTNSLQKRVRPGLTSVTAEARSLLGVEARVGSQQSSTKISLIEGDWVVMVIKLNHVR